MEGLFTSESVTEGHPDKLCDQISDAVLDEVLRQDPAGRVACETSAARGLVLVFGEITTSAYLELPDLVRQVVRQVGYTDAASGFAADSIAVLSALSQQSPDIARGVDHAADDADTQGAGDQGMMFGYASEETPEFMPAPISLAHALTRRLAAVRQAGELPYLLPDGKAQVSVRYADDRPVAIETIVLSAQHGEEVGLETLRRQLEEAVIRPALPSELLRASTRILINPAGRFVTGGPAGDAGLTGRKIIVDTYGGMARHGGGAFSGKDPSKVDRSAAYAARQAAKSVVAAGLARRCEVQIGYAIGMAEPVSLRVDTFGSGRYDDETILAWIRARFDLRPAAIITRLGLRAPIYRQTATYGHFGRADLHLPWERVID